MNLNYIYIYYILFIYIYIYILYIFYSCIYISFNFTHLKKNSSPSSFRFSPWIPFSKVQRFWGGKSRGHSVNWMTQGLHVDEATQPRSQDGSMYDDIFTHMNGWVLFWNQWGKYTGLVPWGWFFWGFLKILGLDYQRTCDRNIFGVAGPQKTAVNEQIRKRNKQIAGERRPNSEYKSLQGYKPINGLINGYIWVITLLIGVITPLPCSTEFFSSWWFLRV